MSKEEDIRLSPLCQNVRFNIPKRQRRDIWKREGNFEYFATEKKLTDLTIWEAEEAAKELESLLNDYFRAMKFPETDEFLDRLYGDDVAFYSGHSQESPFDRTIETLVPHPDLYSEDLLKHMQSGFFNKRPCWRIRIFAWTDLLLPDKTSQPDIMVYPDSIWIGNRCFQNGEWKSELADWLTSMHKRREDFAGPRRRRLNYARSRVGETFPQLKDSSVELLAVVANQDESHSWWILHRPGFFDYVPVLADAASEMHFSVDESGNLRRGGLYDGECCMYEWVLPDPKNHVLTIERTTDQQMFRLEVSNDDILSDENLLELGFE